MAGEEANAIAESTSATQVRSKNGVARTTLSSVDEQAQKIWNVARRTEVSEVQIARAVTGKSNAVASGGSWIKRIAQLRLYGVVEKTDGGFKLTDLGIALANIGDDASHRAALKTAVMGVPANSALLRRYDGGALPGLDTLATEFEFGYSMSNSDAKAVAQVLIDSAKYAGVVDNKGNVHLDGVVIADDANRDGVSEDGFDAPEVMGGTGWTGDVPVPPDTPNPPNTSQKTAPPPFTLTPASSPSALTVKLDMSGWAVEDVLRVLAALGYEGTSRDSGA